MATRAIKPKRDDTMLSGFQSIPERAPSVVREDRPTVTRFLMVVGVLLTAIGVLALLAPVWQFNYMINPTWGSFCLSIGMGFLLFHAFSDKETQWRRIYSLVGLMLMGIAAALKVLPFGGTVGGYFLSLGIPGLFLGLLFVLGVLRNERDLMWKTLLTRVVGVLGAAMIVGSVGYGLGHRNFLIGEGILLLFLGTAYFVTFVSFQEREDISYWSAVCLGLVGVAMIAASVIRGFWPSNEFAVDSAFVMIGFGVLFIVICLGVISDWPLVVLVRRELASYFYSPIGYLVIFGLMLVAWLNYWFLVAQLVPPADALAQRRWQPAFEPIVSLNFVNLITVFAQMFIVPILSMRLMSEEQRSGTLEVLLTAPVNETTVVLSKFFGSLIFFLITWAPYWLFLVGLRVLGGEEFDYRPVLSFALALLSTGAGFMAMGLFFSTITANQIIAAVLTFVGMMFHLAPHMVAFYLDVSSESTTGIVLKYVSFVDLWLNSLAGHVAPRFLVFHLSAAVFFLFLAVKVLESRRWK